MSEFSAIEVVDIAKQIEKCGESFYAEAIRRAKDEKAKEIFTFLHKEEKRHAQVFEDMLGNLKLSGEWRNDDQYLGYMRSLAEKRVFPTPEAAQKAAGALENEAEAVRYALRFERDTIKYFEELKPLIEEEDRHIIDGLIDEEHRHIQTLNDLLGILGETE